MWVSRKRWKALNSEIKDCKNTIALLRKETDEKLYEMAKKILRQPEELSKEIEDREKTDAWIQEFLEG